VPVAFVVAWPLPLFGVPLIGLLLIDVVPGAFRDRRRVA
jgi:hypothetical protein